ncbi:MAG: TIGR02530 family flagellar biosynthesis protein [Eubacteriales bacterium]
MIKNVSGISPGYQSPQSANNRPSQMQSEQGSFGEALQQELSKGQDSLAFSKHAMARAEQRGIEVTADLMDQLASSVEKAEAKGANNILAFDTVNAFIINVPNQRVITTMTQEEMKENIFTNIDGAVLF